MRRRRLIHGRSLLFLWAVIIAGFIYLLIKFAAISPANNTGQAKQSFKEALMSGLCVKAMEKGSSCLSYYADGEEANSFPESLVASRFALHDFVSSDTPVAAMARENGLILPEDYNDYIAGSDSLKLDADTNNKDREVQAKAVLSIGYYAIANDILSQEYIMTNGAVFGSGDVSDSLIPASIDSGVNQNPNLNEVQVGFLEGDVNRVESDAESDDKSAPVEKPAAQAISQNVVPEFTMEQLKDVGFFVRNFYIVDEDTKATDSLFNAQTMLDIDLTLKKKSDAPQILIYHTHSQEAFADSREGVQEDTVVGVGTYLTNILEDEYGYNVIHDTSCYDLINGQLDRNKAYNYARAGIEKILNDNPTIEVIIDLHRDGGSKRIVSVDGKDTAQIMLYNGLCRDQSGPLTRLDNPYLQDNLAFSLKLQMKSIELYPGLFFKNYLNAYRYNQHERKRSILMELGTDKNTLQSAKNAMGPFAEILDSVLKGE